MHRVKKCKKREEKDERIYIRRRNRIRVNWVMNTRKIRETEMNIYLGSCHLYTLNV